jgi:hypothetical protein
MAAGTHSHALDEHVGIPKVCGLPLKLKQRQATWQKATVAK